MKTDVLLIHPPANFDLPKDTIHAIPSYHIGYGLLHIASNLVSNGFKVTVWNLEEAIHSGISQKELERIVKRMRGCEAVGIELNWLHFSKGAIQTAKLLKKVRPEIPIIIGGTHATIFATEIMSKYHNFVDAVLNGEAEKTLVQVVENLEKTGAFGQVGGLVTFENGRLSVNPLTSKDIFENIDEIPPFTYRVVRKVRDGSAARRLFGGSAVNTCRGPCRYECIYCIGRELGSISGRETFAIHSPAWITDQMSLLLEEGCYEFAFQDYLFLSGKKYLRELTESMIKEKLNDEISGFNMTAIPGILDKQILDELSNAGCTNIDYGVETGSDRLLRLLKRPTNRKLILRSVKETISSGIIPFTWWMTGLPSEGKEDLEETLKLIKKTVELGAIPKWVTPLIILPNTELLRNADEFGVIPKLKSFGDFEAFSDLVRQEVSRFPEAVSHETEMMSREDIIRASVYLKSEIFREKDKIIKRFRRKYLKNVTKRHPQLPADWLIRNIEQILVFQQTAFY